MTRRASGDSKSHPHHRFASGGRPTAPRTPCPPRVVIEAVAPEVDAGRFPIKRTVGEAVTVEADIFVDGHDRLSALLLYRPRANAAWTEVAMQPGVNDRWFGTFPVSQLGQYEYTIEAWVDHFGSWTEALAKKVAARQDVQSELTEGSVLVREAAGRAAGADARWLHASADALADQAEPQAKRIGTAMSSELGVLMARYPDRSRHTLYAYVLRVTVERERARFGAWYEMFPRSCGTQPGQPGTFHDCESRLPYIAEMGFDVLYLPPIHPIGSTYRKGRNNAASAALGDPGSPWAIGSRAGGHKGVHPELGTLEDFDRLVAAAARHGIEIALDIAFQCTPDHPYVREHPSWFRHRPDGTIQYAENPPKKYQDIYPLNFESEDYGELSEELRSIFLFWLGHGVRIFRVDNPHTKPFAFWEWVIHEVRDRHPEAIFLSEAFTRPKVMYYLAKAGFSQSYTYFTWRNTREEITEYFTELTQTDVREYMRPNLFTNTPDILHEFLQTGGRPAFQIRLVLAATLGASYGIYGPPFELCEARALPGTEEYLDSEKYQLCSWDLEQPHSLRELIRRLNRARRENPALQHDHSLRFHPVDNNQLIFYAKTTPDLENIILVAVNLDPHHVQTGWVDVPVEELGLDPQQPYQVHDLISDARYLWHGRRNYVALDPHVMPAHVFRVRRRIGSERDFDYFA